MAYSPQYQEVGIPPQQPEEPKTVWWPWRVFTTVTSNMLLLGYLILPVAFEGQNPHLSSDKQAATIVGAAFVAAAYVLSMVLMCIVPFERDFLLHSLFLPCLYSSLLGLFNIVFNILCRDLYPVDSLEMASIVLSGVFGFLYALGALWIYGKGITGVSTGQRYRQQDSYPLLTEDERQRQQLARLLQQKEDMKRKPRPSRHTFKVEIPESVYSGKDYDKGTPPPRYA